MVLDAPADEANDPALVCPHVPAAKRAAHYQAEEAIRRLGGHVDAVYMARPYAIGGLHPIPKSVTSHPTWNTFVYLGEAWQGGDEGLKHLPDLYRLTSVFAAGASITNDGLKQIGQLTELEHLALVETEATDEGLKHLVELKSLLCLWLEGSAGGHEFSDEGLQYVKSPELKELVIYGRGFTADGLKSVGSLPKLFRIEVFDVNMTPSDRARIQTELPPQVQVIDALRLVRPSVRRGG